jgi:hypothetical protein
VQRHGAKPAATFRFTRMHKEMPEHQLGRTRLGIVAKRMTGAFPGPDDSQVPAGYTYFGQFVAHDLSFDHSKGVRLGANLTAAEMKQANSPALDLDSLYGRGPRGKWLKLYDAGKTLLRTGTTLAVPGVPGVPGVPALPGHDLRRLQGKAVIADRRNDDNLAVAQLHAAFIRVHNRVVQEEGLGFADARKLVIRHFQWLVWHDYLPKVCAPDVLADVLANGRKKFDVGVDPHTPPKMPIEFSIAAFRLGHSMVRDVYPWNVHNEAPPLALSDLLKFSGHGGNLGNNPALPSTLAADFRRLFDMRDAGLAAGPAPLIVARRIDVRLTAPLDTLLPGTFDASQAPADPLESDLAFRNLIRAQMVKLATGQDMAKKLGVKALDPQEIAGSDGLGEALGPRGVEHTPLWVYVLREAELHGHRLHGTGARIAAETIHRAIEGSRVSLFRDSPGWQPTLGANALPYSVAHLLLYAAGDDDAHLSPAG